MPTVDERRKLRADFARRDQPFCCAGCGGSLCHSFEIEDGEPVHYSCSGGVKVKGPEVWEKKC